MGEGIDPDVAAKKIADAAVRINRKTKASGRPVQGLAITIAVAPSTRLDLSREVELVKSALLYANEVTLCSPTTTLLASAGALTRLDRQQKMKYIVDIWPTIQPETAANAEVLRRLMSVRHQGGQGFALRLQLDRVLNEHWKGVEAVVNEMLRDAHANELDEPLRKGILKLDLLSEVASIDSLVDAYVERLTRSMSDPHSYPLFDAATGDLVRAGRREGLFAITGSMVKRATQTGLSSGLVSQLPAFPGASMGQVLEARADLAPHVARFRRAIAELQARMQNNVFEEGFSDEVAELYVREVEAAIEGIASAIKRPTLSRLLMQGLAGATPPGGLSLAVLTALHLPAIVSLAVSTAAAAAMARAKLSDEARKRQLEAEKQELFFLYRANEALRWA